MDDEYGRMDPVGCLLILASVLIMVFTFIGAYHTLLWLATQ